MKKPKYYLNKSQRCKKEKKYEIKLNKEEKHQNIGLNVIIFSKTSSVSDEKKEKL